MTSVNQKNDMHYHSGSNACNQGYDEDEISLTELVFEIWKKRLFIFFTVLLIGGATAIYAFLIRTPLYSSSVVITSSYEFGELESLQQSFNIDNISTDWSVVNIGSLRKMLSSTVLRAVYDPELQINAIRKSGLMEQYTDKSPVDESEPEAAADRARYLLEKQLKIDSGKNDVLTITFKSNDRDFSRDFLQDYLLPEIRAYVISAINEEIKLLQETLAQRVYTRITLLERQFLASNQSKEVALKSNLEIARNGNIQKIDSVAIGGNVEHDFLMGVKILEERLKQLHSIMDRYRLISMPGSSMEKPVIPQVSNLYSLLQTLKENDFSTSKIENMGLFQIRNPPVRAEKPDGASKMLITAIGIVLGMMMAVFIVFARAALGQKKTAEPG